MNDNGAFRKKKVYFSQVSNEVLRDNTLSMKAKGLFALIQSYITIEGFTLYKNTLKKDCKEGEKAFEAAWKELKDKGYLIQYKLRNTKGSFYYEYDLLDISHIPKKEGVDFGGVEKGDGGKGGQYINTKPNNTNLNNTTTEKEAAAALPSDNLDKFFKSIKTDIPETAFDRYIKDLVIKQVDDKIIIETNLDFNMQMIKNKYLTLIQIHLLMYFNFKNIEVLSLESLKPTQEVN